MGMFKNAGLFTLAKVAAAGYVVTHVTYMLLMRRYQENAKSAVYIQESLRLLDQYPSVDEVLGKPITVQKINFKDPFIQTSPEKVQAVLPLKAPKADAKLYCWCSSENAENQNFETKEQDERWRVDQLDLALLSGSRQGLSFTIYRHPSSPHQSRES